jgi:DNA-binding response OmpR family regulator
MTTANRFQPDMDGLRILLVEDNFLIASFLQRLLNDWGCQVIGPAPSVTQGRQLASTEQLDGAILDINIVGGDSIPVASVLQQRGCPVIFITGYGSPPGLPPSLTEIKRITKPIDEDVLQELIRAQFVRA